MAEPNKVRIICPFCEAFTDCDVDSVGRTGKTYALVKAPTLALSEVVEESKRGRIQCFTCQQHLAVVVIWDVSSRPLSQQCDYDTNWSLKKNRYTKFKHKHQTAQAVRDSCEIVCSSCGHKFKITSKADNCSCWPDPKRNSKAYLMKSAPFPILADIENESKHERVECPHEDGGCGCAHAVELNWYAQVKLLKDMLATSAEWRSYEPEYDPFTVESMKVDWDKKYDHEKCTLSHINL